MYCGLTYNTYLTILIYLILTLCLYFLSPIFIALWWGKFYRTFTIRTFYDSTNNDSASKKMFNIQVPVLNTYNAKSKPIIPICQTQIFTRISNHTYDHRIHLPRTMDQSHKTKVIDNWQVAKETHRYNSVYTTVLIDTILYTGQETKFNFNCERLVR